MPTKKKPADQPDPDVDAPANEETNEETPDQKPETVRQRPQQPFCPKCGELMRSAGSHPLKTYYKCPVATCGATDNVDRPSPVPKQPPDCPYTENHGGKKVRCTRHVENGIVIDCCPEPGCGFRHDYGPTMQSQPQEGFSAR